MFLYRISGVTVASEVALSGALPLAAGEPDVVIRQGPVAETLPNPSTSAPNWEDDGERFLMRTPGVGRFLAAHGREVTFEPEAGVPAADCAVYLQGTMLAMLLNQRGGILLHASAVAAGGKAVLFCGDSGEGKSTLAAALSLRGHAVLGDDVCVVRFDAAGGPIVSADARQLKLKDTTIAAIGLDDRRGGAAPGQKTYVRPPLEAAAELPLGAIYVLCSVEEGEDRVQPLGGARAFRALAANAFRPGLVQRSGQGPRYFLGGAKILRHAGVFALRRRRDLATLANTAERLESHWREIGLR